MDNNAYELPTKFFQSINVTLLPLLQLLLKISTLIIIWKVSKVFFYGYVYMYLFPLSLGIDFEKSYTKYTYNYTL